MDRNLLFEDENDRIDREAAEWLARSSRGLSDEEKDEYDQWLDRDARHREWTETHLETRSSLKSLENLSPTTTRPLTRISLLPFRREPFARNGYSPRPSPLSPHQ